MTSRERDRVRMMEAIALALQAEGCTRPNPPVGAVIYKGNRKVGSGWHKRAGGPHAEVHAIRDAGKQAQGATLYVTLEPCSTEGKTPACTDAVQAAGIRKVVVGTLDPNPLHAGGGLKILKRAGVEVVLGVESEACDELIEPFRIRMETGRPFVSLKLATSLDGRIADRAGKSKWITGAESRDRVQALRRRCDAVMVGAATIRADNPSLLPRPARGRKPYRIIVGGAQPLRTGYRVFSDSHAERTILAVPASAETAWQRAFRRTSCLLLPVREKGAGRISMPTLLGELGKQDLLHVLCEGGGELAEALVRAQCVNEIHWFTAPCFMGGHNSRPAIGGTGWRMGGLPRVDIREMVRCGNDIYFRARPIEKE